MDRISINHSYFIDEQEYINKCVQIAELDNNSNLNISKQAHKFVQNMRSQTTIMQSFMTQYNLSTNEGVMLMCLAEALLRIPDKKTIDELIKDKIAHMNWYKHINNSDSLFINASTWALMLTGKVLSSSNQRSLISSFSKIITKPSKLIIRKALIEAIKILGRQFVLADTIDEALKNSLKNKQEQYSFDMLGEAALTNKDAEKYFTAYKTAIKKIGTHRNLTKAPSISIKLSALHPRYEFTKKERISLELFPRVKLLCDMAKEANIGICIDAEEADRLYPSLQIVEMLCKEYTLSHWQGIGIAVQAYQKRASSIIDWLVHISQRYHRKFMVRLVKGAYWDYEIKYAQELCHSDYPVFTTKTNTDVNYLACVGKLLKYPKNIYPCFASHNAHTVSYILECIKNYEGEFEFQRLHGMGKELYTQIQYPCRVYAPVGQKKDLLSYLIRRLLENGANSSFINQVHTAPISEIIQDPIRIAKNNKCARNNKIPLPSNIFGSTRINSKGIDMENPIICNRLLEDINKSIKHWQSFPIIDGVISKKNGSQEVFNPACTTETIGETSFSTAEDALLALDIANIAFIKWCKTDVETRTKCLNNIADLYEKNMAHLIAILVKESGKVIVDAISEIREAVDFLRYYALQAKKSLSEWHKLPGVIGESNKINLFGRGVFLCISPWNFPLAIFTGQISAALVTGNTVLAKPSEQSSIIAFEAIKLMHKGGVPNSVLHLLTGSGSKIGNVLIPNKQIAGVTFTGSTETAQIINLNLAQRKCAIAPLIAETGGINAMIVDTSALTEQVTKHVITSAFRSAGQRCSALRVLMLQEEIADKQIEMIIGAMQELKIGDPLKINTDIGPIIDNISMNVLQDYTKQLEDSNFKLLAKMDIPEDLEGYFFPPSIYLIDSILQLKQEAFGPILHIIRYKEDDLDRIIDEINATGYGLTFSVQSRINSKIEYITKKIRAGNIYVNRNQIGAVVESQPFGGNGLSGTGPKAGGPKYLERFCVEQVITVDTTSSCGNIDLLNLQ